MSTIGSLLAMAADPGIKPWDDIVQSSTQTKTGLMNLAELKAKQQAEQAMLERIKNDPDVARQLFGGGPVLGSLMQPQPPPGAGPMTQQTVQPGMPPGAPQTVPGGQDLSRFATQGSPPQSTIGSLGPAGQPQPQSPRNPVLEMARTDPRAAMMLQQQMQGQQDQQIKRQEQRLKIGSAMMDSLGQMAQGVTDQAGWDQMRQDAAQIDPQLAARLEPVYSKEARERLIAQAVGVKDSLTLQAQDLTAQAAVIKARKEGRATDVDNQLRGMGVQPGQETPEQMREAIRLVKEDKKEVSASHGTGQIVMTPAGAVRVGKDNQVEVIKGPDGQPLRDKPTAAAEAAASYGDRAQRAHDNAVALENKGITPTVWSKVGDALPFGLGNYLVGEDQQGYRQAVNQFAGALLRKESGAAISQTEYTMTERTFFPQPGDSKKQIETKRQEREAVIKNLQAEGKGAGRTDTQPQQPTSQGSTGAGGQSQGPATFDRADFLTWRQSAGKTGNPTQADVEAYFQAKGLKRK